MNGDNAKKEFGDYQTPLYFAKTVCSYLSDNLNLQPETIIEPTVGIGAFIEASFSQFDSFKNMIGIEINKTYCAHCEEKYKDKRLQIINEDFFKFNMDKLMLSKKNVLVIGNPPWVTNSDLKFNLPEKSNFKGLSGSDAITGASNFDICEYMILKLINDFKNTNTVIAMLCKTSVARNVFLEINRTSVFTEYVKMLNFNSNKVFDISASACLLVIKLSNKNVIANTCDVSNLSEPNRTLSIIKCENGALSNKNDNVKNFEGKCQFEWRQGVKHDCSSIMELEKIDEQTYINKKKQKIKIEKTFVYPLVKSSGFKTYIINEQFKKNVIVTQKKIKEDTSYIKNVAPQTWNYLIDNKDSFDKRKSSIYKGSPDFSMFGIGEYSYSKFKVGISGFYKKPIFSLLYNKKNIEQPVMVDDTAYFIPFEKYDDAYVCMVLLNNYDVQKFLSSISFKDAKRPYTKKVLQRLDFKKLIDNISFYELKETEKNLNLKQYLNEGMYTQFKRLVVQESGRSTDISNCAMLCKTHNRAKGINSMRIENGIKI